MNASGITLLVTDQGWRKARGLTPKLKRAALAALAVCKFRGASSLTLLLSSDRHLKSLNRDFRGKDKPTNVLSFPAAANGAGYRGDVALAYATTRREAKAAGKDFADHAAHLVVHGVLHLAGYDHVRGKDAKVMEPLETRILAGMGIADPYAEPKARAR